VRVPRIFHPEPLSAGIRVALDERASHHLAHVLRVRIGDPLVLFDGARGEYLAQVAHVDRRGVAAEVAEYVDVNRESPLDTTLIQGVSRGERMDYTIQKAVELGVRRIAPVLSERSVAKLDPDRRERKQLHWSGVAIGASEQSGRTHLPAVEPLEDFAARVARETASVRLLLHPEGAGRLAQVARPAGGVVLLVGPEGGLSDAEVDFALRHGYVPIALGPRVMRTETAGVVALAALQLVWGDLPGGAGNR
jgi:16S rRNA (uracil1498-N3)-methyltransferase